MTQALGLGEGLAPEFAASELGSGDILLLCSDGLWEAMSADELAAIERVFLSDSSFPPRAMVLVDREQRARTFVMTRGDPLQRGAPVEPRFLTLLEHLKPGGFQQGSGRLELAEAIVHPDNPLTPRVLVNRVWAWHFGRPLVETIDDFGKRKS